MAQESKFDTAALISERGLFLTIYDIMDLLKVSRPVADRLLKIRQDSGGQGQRQAVPGTDR